MVFVKVSDGYETRKLQISDQITYGELKDQVARLFPRYRGREGGKFELQYRDTDGDLIAFSSDEELRTALAHLPPDTVWRLEIMRPPSRERSGFGPLMRLPSRGMFGELEPFGNFEIEQPFQIDPFWSPFGMFSSDRERRLREWQDHRRAREEQIEQQFERMRRMQEEHTRQFEEQRKKAEEEIRKAMETQRERQLERQRSAGGAGPVAEQGQPKWHCQTFGSWDPVSYESPYGTRTVIGPVGYHMYWGYSDPEVPMEGTSEGEQKSEPSTSETKPTESR